MCNKYLFDRNYFDNVIIVLSLHKHMHIHAYIHTHIHTHTHIYIHIHRPLHIQPSNKHFQFAHHHMALTIIQI